MKVNKATKRVGDKLFFVSFKAIAKHRSEFVISEVCLRRGEERRHSGIESAEYSPSNNSTDGFFHSLKLRNFITYNCFIALQMYLFCHIQVFIPVGETQCMCRVNSELCMKTLLRVVQRCVMVLIDDASVVPCVSVLFTAVPFTPAEAVCALFHPISAR